MLRNLALILLLSLSSLTALAAKVERITLPARGLIPEDMKAVIITPEASAPEEGFPTLYLLHGHTDCEESWLEIRPDLPSLADSFGMVIVMPDGMDSWYWDSPASPTMRMETFIVSELIPYIDTHYPTVTRAEMRAVTGLSMGGQGALSLAMRHPDLFRSAGSMSGVVDIRAFPGSWNVAALLGPYADNPDVWDSMAVIKLAETIAPGDINIIIDSGVDDFVAATNEQLHQRLLALGIPHDYTSRPGAHKRPYWTAALPHHLLFFHQIFTRSTAP